MNEIYKFVKGKPLNSELVGIARFELLITDANGSVVGTVDPKYMFCDAAVYPGAAERLMINAWDMTRSYGNIKDFSLELNEEEKFFIINDDQGFCLFATVTVGDVALTKYGQNLFYIHSDNTVDHHEIDNSCSYDNSSNTDHNEPYNPLADNVSLI